MVLLLRHPVERAVSHFCYFRDILPRTNAMALARVPEILDIKDSTLGLLEFVSRLGIDHFYHAYLGLPDTRSFRMVGFTDRIADFGLRLHDKTGIDLASSGHEREHPGGLPQMPKVAALERMLAAESEWYLEHHLAGGWNTLGSAIAFGEPEALTQAVSLTLHNFIGERR